MRLRESGFTLIELVIVITIIGILAAVALPRYVAMQSEARTSKAMAIYGAIKSGAALAKARCELDLAQLMAGGTCTATGGTVNMDGASVDMVNRYPKASLEGIDRAAQISTSEGIAIGGSGSVRTYDMNGAVDVANCRITYNEAPSGGSPNIQIVTSGC